MGTVKWSLNVGLVVIKQGRQTISPISPISPCYFSPLYNIVFDVVSLLAQARHPKSGYDQMWGRFIRARWVNKYGSPVYYVFVIKQVSENNTYYPELLIKLLPACTLYTINTDFHQRVAECANKSQGGEGKQCIPELQSFLDCAVQAIAR